MGGRRDFVVENRMGVGGRPGTPGPVGGPEPGCVGEVLEGQCGSQEQYRIKTSVARAFK